uniref:Uncharacterized protein n=1 Tax=Rhizophora mucronata TaxID=61149 RepID=A0A2P2NAP6_RHIMU
MVFYLVDSIMPLQPWIHCLLPIYY